MPGLTDNEARALTYFAIGVASEGGDSSYRLAFAGNIRNGVMDPVGNSGFSIGTLQTDLGQHPEVATSLTDAYQSWAQREHPEWALNAAQRTQTIADLSRTGHQIEAQHGRAMDATVKSHLDSFMASDAGKTFVHQHDVAQSNRLMDNVVTPLKQTDLYKHASEQDQARLITMTAKLYNQNENYGNALLRDIEQNKLHSEAEVKHAIDGRPGYVRDGRDHALAGAELFNDMRAMGANSPLRPAWDNVVANPLVNPTQLGNDPTHPNLPHEYAAIRDAYTDTTRGRGMVHALEQGGSYANTQNGRGYLAEGRDLVTWDKSGHGHALVNGQWRSVESKDVSTHVNADKTMDVNLRHAGQDERLLHITHPGNARGHVAHTSAPAAGDHVQRPGSLREHDRAPQVGELQSGLAALGYRGADGKVIHPDNDFGGNTKAALQNFQRAHGLEPDGIAGTKTLDALHAAQKSPSLADPVHPGHVMYEQALKAVGDLDASRGRTPDQQSRNLAGALTDAAHAQGLTRIDNVTLSGDGTRAYAVQGDMKSPFKQIAQADTTQAVKQPLEQSGANWQQPSQAQSPQAQNQQQQQQQPTMGR
ncbi:MAG: peptidoglycan-binding domain-containing protein [Luteibacter sp.]